MRRVASVLLTTLLASGAATDAHAQQSLPTLTVGGVKPSPARRHTARRVVAKQAPAPAPRPRAAPKPPAEEPEAASLLTRLQPKTAANVYTLSRETIEAAPQGGHAPLNTILLRAPGVTRDSAEGGGVHVRNEHANLQYRIDGVMLPDGVAGFGQGLDASLAQSVSLVTGALPAQYGLRMAGLVDIVTLPPPQTPGGGVEIYGGSHESLENNFDYAGAFGKWRVLMTGRWRTNTLGVENTEPSHEALHDRTRQGRVFGLFSYALDDATKLVFMTGSSAEHYQVSDLHDLRPAFTAFGVGAFDSARLNENQGERGTFNVAAVQHSQGALDAQLSLFSRVTRVHFLPDRLGDLIFNGVASDVSRQSVVGGAQGDAAWRVTDDHTLRAGFVVSAERTRTVNASLLLPLDAGGEPLDAPYGVTDATAHTGWLYGIYAQDAWKLDERLTLNAGLRLDHSVQYVSATQLSPRLGAEFHATPDTTLHLAYARNFTPPSQALVAPAALALYAGSTQAPVIALASPVRPERAHYFDAGVTHRLTPELEVGVSAYLKHARDLLDDGQFGAALVQTAFNYERAYNSGVEAKAAFKRGDFSAYANFAVARQRATRVASNQYLFAADEFVYLAQHYIYTDHAQAWTGSAGVSHVVAGTTLSAEMLAGAGLRAGFVNTARLAPYAQFNLGASRDVEGPWGKPLTLRFDVVNLFDHAYKLRDGTGIGVFGPQYGPRRGFFLGVRQAL